MLFVVAMPKIGYCVRTRANARLLTFQGGNKTISIITLMVVAENNDAELVCRASNPWFPNDTIEDKRIISVACKYLNLFLWRSPIDYAFSRL